MEPVGVGPESLIDGPFPPEGASPRPVQSEADGRRSGSRLSGPAEGQVRPRVRPGLSFFRASSGSGPGPAGGHPGRRAGPSPPRPEPILQKLPDDLRPCNPVPSRMEAFRQSGTILGNPENRKHRAMNPALPSA